MLFCLFCAALYLQLRGCFSPHPPSSRPFGFVGVSLLLSVVILCGLVVLLVSSSHPGFLATPFPKRHDMKIAVSHGEGTLFLCKTENPKPQTVK